MSNLLKNLLFALVLAVIAYLAYVVFIKDDEALLESTNNVESQAAIEAQSFLARLQQLRQHNIEGEIFRDQRFNSLVNFRQELGEEPTGRDNPFAPVE